MSLLEGLSGQVADLLFELGAVKFGAFRLKLHDEQPDAPLSPIYFELRTADHPKKPGPLNEEVMELIGQLFLDKVRRLKFDCYTGLPAAGEPFADEVERAVAGWQPPPQRLTLVKKDLPDGKRRIEKHIQGVFAPGQRVLVLDDLVTQADTKLEGIAALENSGLNVALVLVLIDRMQGGKEQLEDAGYDLQAIFTLRELLDHYVARRVLLEPKAMEVWAYALSNRL